MTTSRHRILFIIAFALLFLGMQREAQVHALQHLGAIFHSAKQDGVQAPAADVTCLECSLLAAGSSVLAADLPALPPAAVAAERIFRALVSRTLAAPSYYSCRAPPSLL